MCKQDEKPFDQGYDIDRHAAGSDAWHYWMDEAKRLTDIAQGRQGA